MPKLYPLWGGGSSYQFKYVFTYTDHLGNIRLKYAQDPSNNNQISILEEDHYYPYGLKHSGYNSFHQIFAMDDDGDGPGTGIVLTPVNPFLGDSHKYKFGGKEYQDEFDVNTYDFGARNYDPALARWMNLDPLAELMRRHSPYNYAFNNPVYFIDPDGMMATYSDGYVTKDLSTATGAIDTSTMVAFTFDNNGNTLDAQIVNGDVSYNKNDGKISSAVSANNSGAYKSFFQQAQKDIAKMDVSVDNETGCPEPCPWGTITERPTTWVDTWAESSNIFAQVSYEVINSFSIVGQSLNPFDNQVTTLTGEGLNGTDRSAHGATVAATLLPIGGASGLKYSSSLLKISNPNALTRSLPGFTDKVSGSVLRQGRGPLIDYPTKQPALRSLNSQKLNKYGQWVTGIGLSGAASYYYYKKAIQKK